VAPLSSSADDPQEHLERMMPLARGPQGEPGEPGKRGERGLSQLQGRAVIVLFAIAVVLGVFNLFWTSHSVGVSAAATARVLAAQQRQAAAEQAKWCSLIVTLDQANAAAPKKPAAGTFTAAFVAEIRELRKSLGCGS
jgi:hypothetical protein